MKFEAKDHARDILCADFDTEILLDDAKSSLQYAGFWIEDIYWSGFSSQGDGACFNATWYANDVDAAAMRKHASEDTELHEIADAMEEVAKQFPKASMKTKHSGHYCHERSVTYDIELDRDDYEPDDLRFAVINALWEQTEAQLQEITRRAMRWIYCQLEKEYEYQQSGEALTDCDYDFTPEGTIE